MFCSRETIMHIYILSLHDCLSHEKSYTELWEIITFYSFSSITDEIEREKSKLGVAQ